MVSVHFVDLIIDNLLDPSTLWILDLDPLWDPSTLWTYLIFLTLVGSVHVVDWSLDPSWGPSTLWTGVLILCEVRPLCGLDY